MSIDSKAWDWEKETHSIWLRPSEESHYLARRWRAAGFSDFLDFGCGLGRHAVFFAEHGFRVSAFDLSREGVAHLREWASAKGLNIRAEQADMLAMPFAGESFDCLLAYHVVSHTDTKGFLSAMREIRRVLRPGAELYMTLCSKETWAFAGAGYPKIDENTLVKTDEGPEKGVPHFYTDLDTVIEVFEMMGLRILQIRHIDDCYFEGAKRDSKHFFILAQKIPGASRVQGS